MSQYYDYIGVVKRVNPTQTLKNNFLKRELIMGDDIGTNSKYPNTIKFILKQDKCSSVDCVKPGARVKIMFTIDGREWDGPSGLQVFNDLVALKVEVLTQSETQEQPPTETAAETNAGNGAKSYEEIADDMPF